MGTRRGQLSLMALCCLLGLLLVSQFRIQEKIAADLRAQSPQNQLTLLASLIDSNARLRDEVASLEAQRAATDGAGEPAITSQREELERLRLLNGLVEAAGPGLQVTLDANLEAYWLQDILNELRNAGAEALSLNGHRLLAASVLTGNPRELLLDGAPISRPYVIEATGDQEALFTALNRPGGLILQLRAQYGAAMATLSRQPQLRLPPHPTGRRLS